MENKKGKSRGANFSEKEDHILMSLVKKYKCEIECKKTDTNTNKIKNEAWIKVAQHFNSMSGGLYRDEKGLRNRYENIKKRTKQKFADEKKYITGTGGGPAKAIVISTVENDIQDIIGTQLTGRNSEFDDDTADENIIISYDDNYMANENMSNDGSQSDLLNKDPENKRLSTILTKSEEPRASISSDWSTYTPSKLRAPKHVTLQTGNSGGQTPTHRKRPDALKNKLEAWVENKTNLTNIQEQCFLEQHNLKMNNIREKHKRDMELLERDAADRREFMRIEHEERLKILKLNKN